VADFGVAKALEQGAASTAGDGSTRLTQAVAGDGFGRLVSGQSQAPTRLGGQRDIPRGLRRQPSRWLQRAESSPDTQASQTTRGVALTSRSAQTLSPPARTSPSHEAQRGTGFPASSTGQ
jgi:hypothetical protein